jgi:hypothetical protein
VYTEQRGRIKQAIAQVAELHDSTNGEVGISKKSNKKFSVTTAEASPTHPALQVDLVSEIKQAQEAADKAKSKREQATMDIQHNANLLSADAKYAWNKIVHKQQHLTPTQTFKAVPRKDPGDFCASHLMTVQFLDIGHDFWQNILAIITKRHNLLNASC